MKIKPEHFEYLKQRIKPLDSEERRNMYKSSIFPASTDVEKRYRWDLLWISKIKIGDGVGMKGDIDLYAYMNDSHIDTALKKIVPPLCIVTGKQIGRAHV